MTPGEFHSGHPSVPYRPFDKIPPELTSHILSLTWCSHYGDDSVDRFHFPSIPCQVDQTFNRITCSTPTPWSYLRVTWVTDWTHIQERIEEGSGARPLELYLQFDKMNHEEASTLVERTIMRSPLRFRTITLSYRRLSPPEIPGSRGFWDHLALLNEHPLQVSRFSIEAEAAPPLDSLPPFAPSIRDLSLACNQFDWSLDSFPNSLDTLSIQDKGSEAVRTAKITNFLSYTPFSSLRSLFLSDICIEWAGEVLEKTCVLELVEYFSLGQFYLWETAILISSILTPNLRHLSINVAYHTIIPDALHTAWKAIRFPNLHRLTLEGFKNCTSELVELLQELPLSTKRLDMIGAGPLKALHSASAATFCGQLRQIVAHEIPLNTIIRLVQGRCHSLQELKVGYEDLAKVYTWEEFTRHSDTLESSGTKLLVMGDGRDRRVEEPPSLTIEQLVTSFERKQGKGPHPSVVSDRPLALSNTPA